MPLTHTDTDLTADKSISAYVSSHFSTVCLHQTTRNNLKQAICEDKKQLFLWEQSQKVESEEHRGARKSNKQNL